MTLSRLTEEFLKFVLEQKKAQDFVVINEQELPENLKKQIFGLADELKDAGYINNVRKYGQIGNRGIDFFILPRGLSYFEEKNEQKKLKLAQLNTFEGPIVIGSNNVTNGVSVNNQIPVKEEKKSWFEKYGPIFIPALIAGVFAIIAVILGNKPVPGPLPTLTPNLTQTGTFMLAPIATLTQVPLLTPTFTSTQISTEAPSIPACSLLNGPITVGVLDLRPNYIFEDIFERLRKIGLKPEWVAPPSTYNSISSFNVIYLPSGWGNKKSELERYPNIIRNFVNNGGGLLVEQPNSDETFSPTFLPYPITYISNKMDPEDWPLQILDSSHFLTRGLSENALPGPMDCANMDRSYFPMVKGIKTNCVSMAITSYGSGRILISMGNASPSMKNTGYPTISDEALCRMFEWLSKNNN
jgi:hypothetical protein